MVDAVGNLYVVDGSSDDASRWIQQRDSQGNWSVLATFGSALGQVNRLSGLTVDPASNLYVADSGNNRVTKYTPGP